VSALPRLGVFGGTFDPPHLGHLLAASEAAAVLELERVLWIPAALHPFKQGRVAASPALRLEMTRAAVAGDPRFAVDPLELERGGPSYTVETLAVLQAREPGAELYFVTGADNLRELHLWHRADEVLRLARLVVVTRAGEGAPRGGEHAAREVPVPRLDVSSSVVRRRVAAGECIRYLVPEAVRAVIAREGLYRD
jgi:nicotinate-nucleotide adenylyltransferase